MLGTKKKSFSYLRTDFVDDSQNEFPRVHLAEGWHRRKKRGLKRIACIHLPRCILAFGACIHYYLSLDGRC